MPEFANLPRGRRPSRSRYGRNAGQGHNVPQKCYVSSAVFFSCAESAILLCRISDLPEKREFSVKAGMVSIREGFQSLASGSPAAFHAVMPPRTLLTEEYPTLLRKEVAMEAR